ncbi:hypothetical protein VHEMI06978 [[Torrubiella] hemipterigena]|uniref:POPLD domain-containing protein n=1 Tax=[Torrubiella] hemipterigena TaxID=1531966 RepID=A0A0A1T8Z6_9HYPO|nr:hypothetical protein VHEMI06978 [[Torrubiella] hemipterigena]
MASKQASSGAARPGGARGGGDAFHQQRAKIHAARHIPAQPAESVLKDGELDLQAFVAAHEFQIKSLEQSMATSKAASSTRAFQHVPRGLRRRTASHNPKRVPRRLRERAKKEMAQDNTPLVEPRRRKPKTTRSRLRAETAKRLGKLAALQKKRKKEKADANEEKGIPVTKPKTKIRRNEVNAPPQPPAKFRRRQLNKTWLPTHLWHAKRARMTLPKHPLWRFAIPMTPSEKIYRPTHRAQGDRGTVIWDTSYMSTIGLYGVSAGMERVLKALGITDDACWNDRGVGWRSGCRAWVGSLSRSVHGTRRAIGPAQVIWNPQSEEDTAQGTKAQRQAYIRVHPASFLETFNALLHLIKMENPRLYIEDLRFEIGSIELTGPASTEVLLSVLTPYKTQDKSHKGNATLFKSLKGLTNPAALPDRSLLSFSVQDPRLRYPPRKMEVESSNDGGFELMKLVAEWPAKDHLRPAALFDRKARHRATCLPSQQSINRRRSKAAPGEYAKAMLIDPPIPVMLLATRSGSNLQTQGTWTLMLPWKCVLPVWYSIVHCPLLSGGNPRFAGLNESMQVAFERSLPWFPADYITTDAGATWELDQRAERRKAWEKKPKSKRTEWSSLPLGSGRKGEVGDGLACDFETLFGLGDSVVGDKEQTSDANDMDWTPTNNKVSKANVRPLDLLNNVSTKTFRELVATPTATIPVPNALLTIRISIIARGVGTSCARIYRLPRAREPISVSNNTEVPATIPDAEQTCLPHDLRQQWLNCAPANFSTQKRTRSEKQAFDIKCRKQRLAQELTAPPAQYPPLPSNMNKIDDHHPLVPDAEDLIGFITSGSFNLAAGRGTGLGAISAAKVLADVRDNSDEGRLCIVRNAGENVGWLAKWEMI